MQFLTKTPENSIHWFSFFLLLKIELQCFGFRYPANAQKYIKKGVALQQNLISKKD